MSMLRANVRLEGRGVYPAGFTPISLADVETPLSGKAHDAKVRSQFHKKLKSFPSL